MAIDDGFIAVDEYKLIHTRYDGPGPQNPDFDEVDKPRGSGIISRASWAFEILSSLCSLATLSSIIIILWMTNGKPVSDWTFRISLSATIAILSTISSAALMHNVSSFISQLKWLYFKKEPRRLHQFELFDEASRGPYGSIIFLFGVKWNLATIGAFITIFRLASSPLIQQAIQLKTQNAYLADEEATLGYAQMYMRDLRLDSNVSPSDYPQDAEMESAILRGIYGISNTPAYSCSGSCSWNTSHVSLGFKTTCTDVSSEAFATKKCGHADGQESCDMTTPQGISLTPEAVKTDDFTTFILKADIGLISSPNTSAPDTDETNVLELVKFAVYRIFSPKAEDLELHAIQHLDASTITDCVLSLTAFEYPGASSNGSTFTLDEPMELRLIPSNKTYATNQTDYFAFDAVGEKSTTEVVIGYDDVASIQSYFMSNMISTEWIYGGGVHNVNYGISAALVGDVDLQERFEGMAASMTTYLRSGPNSKTLTGFTVVERVYVHVQRYWLIGPIAMQLAAVLLAFFTVAWNQRTGSLPWKSSTLAILACSHDESAGTIRSRKKSLRDIEQSAKESFVKLV